MSSIPINTLDNTTTSPKNANEKGTPKLDNTLIIDTTPNVDDRHISLTMAVYSEHNERCWR